MNYLHINANGTYYVKKGPGILGGVTINTDGTSTDILTLYDGFDTNGTVMGVIDASIAASPDRIFNANFQYGLIAVLSGGGTASDLTITYG